LSAQHGDGGRPPGETSLADMHPADIASHLQQVSLAEAVAGLRSLSLRRRAATYSYLAPKTQVALARKLARTEFAGIVAEMGADDRVSLFRRLPRDQQSVLLHSLARAQREEIRRLAGHREGTAGAIMTSDYATVAPTLSAAAALAKLRQEAPKKETIYQTYMVDEDGRLIGTIDLQALIMAAPETLIADLAETDTHAIRMDQSQKEAAERIARYDLLALPVLDAQHRLVGIITHDDALDVLERENTIAFHRSAIVTPILDHVHDASIGLLYRRRIVWLIALVFGNLFSGAGIAYFEDVVAANVALVFFLPLLVGSGGNTGSQASTLMIRALATGDVVPADLGRLLAREIVVSIALGVSMAATVWGLGLMRGGPEIAAVVAISMLLVVVINSLIGTALPFVLNRLGADSATASAPLIATIADALGVVIYFAVAATILPVAAA
jgi:magnesium transporter